MNTFNSQELRGLLEQHNLWIEGSVEGVRADLRYADLRYVNLRNVNLSNADLRNVNLSNADLSNTDLSNADLSNAALSDVDLSDANLRYVNLRYANLSDANLSDANLKNADLRYANLRNVDLDGCVGNGREIQSIQTPKYLINITKDDIQIGCKRHTIKAWLSFSDDVIQDMDRGALDWWKMYKPILTSLLNVKLG
jgi:uncharacterized protein YjbI with pentapeptide repeats